MMKIVADLHTHTIACGHAYSSLTEMAEGARRNGIEVMATTDHGPNMPGAATLEYFWELVRIPEVIAGTRVLRGVEANIIGSNGELDVPDELLAQMEIVLVGFHPMCGYKGETISENTKAMIGAIENPLVDLVVHPGNPNFPIDVERVVAAALANDVILEVNNSTFRGSRIGSDRNCRSIAEACKKAGLLISVDSDAHLSFDVGRLDYGLALIKELEFTPDQVLNTSVERVMEFVQHKGLIKAKYREIVKERVAVEEWQLI